MDEIKKLQNRINQLESEMEGLDDSGIDQYADEIYRLEKQIERLKLKKEDIEKYATDEEKKILKEVRSLFKHSPESPVFKTKMELNQIMHLLADLDKVSLEKIKKEVEFLLAAKEYEE
jgi:septal ring factor EnvC (AmiA/AmiB activator)